MRNSHTHRALVLSAFATVFAVICQSRESNAQSCTLNRRAAAHVSRALRSVAPAWARPLVTPAILLQYERENLRPFTYFLGYALLPFERLGINGAQPFRASVVLRCRDGAAEIVTDPLAWGNLHARELRMTITNAEMASGFATEVVTLQTGQRPETGRATRAAGSPTFRVTITMAPRQGSTGTETQLYEVERDATIRAVAP
ncbi:MAG: hypothetical protein Q8Q09_09405 [Deltaproteobacteria bacterium]|nr:hypothetical protein [Deltaproteobacteria bacterium]